MIGAAAVTAKLEYIARKATSLAQAVERGSGGNLVADGGFELDLLVRGLREHTDSLGDEQWRKTYLVDPPPF